MWVFSKFITPQNARPVVHPNRAKFYIMLTKLISDHGNEKELDWFPVFHCRITLGFPHEDLCVIPEPFFCYNFGLEVVSDF